jgi:hypothetical protein
LFPHERQVAYWEKALGIEARYAGEKARATKPGVLSY